jgi:alpha-beta hydrolase superfamily lysophospholipase
LAACDVSDLALQEALMTGTAAHDTTEAPDTIVLIHGFWVTPRSWEHWVEHYENRGFKVLAPA